jgi:hypothetical protein
LARNAASAECDVCRRHAIAGTGYRLQTPQGPLSRCLGCALRYRPLLRRSALIALVVGSVLVAINQGDVLVAGRWNPAIIWKVSLTYLVPFVVAIWGALINSRVG